MSQKLRAANQKLNESYVSRILRLTLLAPAIVEAILDGRHALEVTLPMLMGVFPVEWDRQWTTGAILNCAE